MIAYDPTSGVCLLRCGRDDLDRVWTALVLRTMIAARIVSPRVVRVAGRVEDARKATLEAAREALASKDPDGRAEQRLAGAGKAARDAFQAKVAECVM